MSGRGTFPDIINSQLTIICSDYTRKILTVGAGESPRDAVGIGSREKSWIEGDHCNEGVEVDTKVINEGQARMSDTRVKKPKSVYSFKRQYRWEKPHRWSMVELRYVLCEGREVNRNRKGPLFMRDGLVSSKQEQLSDGSQKHTKCCGAPFPRSFLLGYNNIVFGSTQKSRPQC